MLVLEWSGDLKKLISFWVFGFWVFGFWVFGYLSLIKRVLMVHTCLFTAVVAKRIATL